MYMAGTIRTEVRALWNDTRLVSRQFKTQIKRLFAFRPQEHEEKSASDLGLHSSSKSTKPRKVLINIWETIQSGAPGFSIEPDGKIAFGDVYMRTPPMNNYQAAQGMPVAPHHAQQPQQPQYYSQRQQPPSHPQVQRAYQQQHRGRLSLMLLW